MHGPNSNMTGVLIRTLLRKQAHTEERTWEDTKRNGHI